VKPLRSLLSILVVGACLLAPLDAEAFKRSRDPESNACLWWEQRSISVYLHQDCSVDVGNAACINAVWSTLDEWNLPICSDWSFISAGTTSRTDLGFDEDHWDDNINLIIWQESEWRDDTGERDPRVIALTTTTYDRLTGEIVDTDVEFNGRDFTFTTAESGQVLVDIANTLAHEAGHMLGLDHSTDLDSTMYSYAPQGEVAKRDLYQDDIDGLCHIYPAGRDLPPCEGFIPPDDDDKGCDGCSSTGLGAGLGLTLLVFGLLFMRGWRRKENE
jgi:hypothetical protein